MNKTTFFKPQQWITAAAMSAIFLAGAAFAQAQTAKPVMVVSLPSVDELLANVDFLGQLGGQPNASMMINGLIQAYTQGQGLKGLDKSKPLGFVVGIADDGSFAPAVLIPVTSAKDLAGTLAMMHLTAPAQDEGGVMKLTAPNGMDLFVREQSGWAFVTQAKDTPLPSDDPMKLMAGINPDYDLGIRILLQNVPEEKKKSLIEQFRGFMEFAAAAQQRQQGADNPFSTLSQKNLEQQVAAIEQLLNEANQITIGWKIDRAAKNTYLDFSVTAVPGSQLDQCMKQMASGTTNFAGFIMPDSALTLNFSGKNSQENIDQTLTTLEQLKGKAEEAIDKDPDLANDKRDSVKQVLHEFLDVAENTVKAGKSDGGAVVQVGAGKFQAAAGGFVADGPALEKAVKDVLTLAQGEPQFTEQATVKLDLETYKDVHFHQVSVKLPEEAGDDAKKIFGDTVDIYFGAGPQNAYIAAGKGSLDLVKAVIDHSAAEPNKAVPPLQMSIALTPIADFVGSLNDAQAAAGGAAFSQALSQTPGKDHVTLNAHLIPNGFTYRLMVEEGVLKAIGAMATHTGGPGGPAGAPSGPNN
ncbi:MAG TPA: hypothetical protein VMJ32_00425 [Pirellulales bacterium]|nr:hypothetical protein [Pirellulales bacterium]